MSGRKYFGIVFAFAGILIAAVVGIILAANWSELGYKRELKKIYFKETSELVYLGVDSFGHEQRIVAEKGYSNGQLLFTGRLVHLEKDDRGRWTMKGQSAPKEITDQSGYFYYDIFLCSHWSNEKILLQCGSVICSCSEMMRAMPSLPTFQRIFLRMLR